MGAFHWTKILKILKQEWMMQKFFDKGFPEYPISLRAVLPRKVLMFLKRSIRPNIQEIAD